MIGAQHCQATPRTLFPPWWCYRAGTCAVPNPTKFFARSAGRGSLRHTPPPRCSVGVCTPCHVWGRSSVESRPDRRWSRGVRPPPPWGRCTRLVRPWAAVGASCGPTAVRWLVGVWTPWRGGGARARRADGALPWFWAAARWLWAAPAAAAAATAQSGRYCSG